MPPLKRRTAVPKISPAHRSYRLTVVEHLEELRWRLAVSAACVLLATEPAYFFSDGLTAYFLRPIHALGQQVYFTSIPEAFLVKLKMSLLAGFLASLPVLAYQVWAF